MRKTIHLSLGLLLILLVHGCTTIPPEAPELSTQLGQRIAAIESAHLTLIGSYFDEKRNRVDEHIQEDWVPLFAQNVFKQPRMVAMWNTIVRENNTSDRLEFILRVAPKLQSAINSKRIELIAPLDDLERAVERKVKSEYQQAHAMNNTLTSFLFSASEVSENRNRYLSQLGLEQENLAELINNTDSAVSDLVDKTLSAQEKSEKFMSKIKKVKDKL